MILGNKTKWEKRSLYLEKLQSIGAFFSLPAAGSQDAKAHFETLYTMTITCVSMRAIDKNVFNTVAERAQRAANALQILTDPSEMLKGSATSDDPGWDMLINVYSERWDFCSF